MASTQDFITVEDIHDDVVILKDGSVAVVLQTSAVNFDLLSENEQLAIIGSFAALLNSLSFSIQILIRSKRLDITHYLKILQNAERGQKNPLLLLMMQHYRQFVTNIIRENEVLDKQFYVIIAVSSLELGVVKNTGKNFQKALTLLGPRRDNVIRQLSRIGLKSTQLSSEKLIRLFYDIYNDSFISSFATLDNQPIPKEPAQAAAPAPQPQAPMPLPSTPPPQQRPTISPIPQAPPLRQAVPTQPRPVQSMPSAMPSRQVITPSRPASAGAPFVVEELPDDYGVV